MRTVKRIDREVSECPGRRRAENAVLKRGIAGGRVEVQQVGIDEEDSLRRAEHTEVLFQLLQRHPEQLRRVAAGIEAVERRAVGSEVERRPCLVREYGSKGPYFDHLAERSPGIAKVAAPRTERQIINHVRNNAVSLV